MFLSTKLIVLLFILSNAATETTKPVVTSTTSTAKTTTPSPTTKPVSTASTTKATTQTTTKPASTTSTTKTTTLATTTPSPTTKLVSTTSTVKTTTPATATSTPTTKPLSTTIKTTIPATITSTPTTKPLSTTSTTKTTSAATSTTPTTKPITTSTTSTTKTSNTVTTTASSTTSASTTVSSYVCSSDSSPCACYNGSDYIGINCVVNAQQDFTAVRNVFNQLTAYNLSWVGMMLNATNLTVPSNLFGGNSPGNLWLGCGYTGVNSTLLAVNSIAKDAFSSKNNSTTIYFGISNCDLASANFSFSFLQPFSSSLQGLWFSTIRLHGNTLRANTINITSSKFNYMGIWGSQLQSVEPGALIGNFSSAYIYLDNNNMTSFRSDVYLSVLQKMTNNIGGVSIYNNPIQYDCNLKWLIVDHPEWVSIMNNTKVNGQIANGTYFHQLDARVMASECGGNTSTTTAPGTGTTTSSTTTSPSTTVSPYTCSFDSSFLNVNCVVNAQQDFTSVQTIFTRLTTLDLGWVSLTLNASNLSVPPNVLGGKRPGVLSLNCGSTGIHSPLIVVNSIAMDAFSPAGNSTTGDVHIVGCDLTSPGFTFEFLQPLNASLQGLGIYGSRLAFGFQSMPLLPALHTVTIEQSSGLRQWYPPSRTINLYYVNVRFSLDYDDTKISYILGSLTASTCDTYRSPVAQLDLTGLSLTQVPPQISSFTSLQYLNLNQNPLKTLCTNSINITSPRFTYLSLMNMQLQSVEPGAFVGNFSSTYIDLSSNNLTRFTSDVYLNLLKTMAIGSGSINVQNNPIQYDCSLKWLIVQNAALVSNMKVYGQIANGTSFSQLNAKAMANECISAPICSNGSSPCTCTIGSNDTVQFISCTVNAQQDFSAIRNLFNQSTPLNELNGVSLMLNTANLAIPSNLFGGNRPLSLRLGCGLAGNNSALFAIDSIAQDAFSPTGNSITTTVDIYNCDVTSANFSFAFLQPFNSSLNWLNIDRSRMAPAFQSMPNLPNVQQITIQQSIGLRQWYPLSRTANLRTVFLFNDTDLDDDKANYLLGSLATSTCNNSQSSPIAALALTGSSLTKIPPLISAFGRLQYLDFSYNPLRTLRTNSVNITSAALSVLSLTHTQLASVEPGAFIGDFSSTYVDLSNNNLTSFTSDVYLSLAQSMAGANGGITVAKNPIHYSCNLTWLIVDRPEWVTKYKVVGQIANGTYFYQLDAGVMANECGSSTSTTTASTTSASTPLSPYVCSSDSAPCACYNGSDYIGMNCVVNAQQDFTAVRNVFNQLTAYNLSWVGMMLNATNLTVPSNLFGGNSPGNFWLGCGYTGVNSTLLAVNSIAKDAFSSKNNSTTIYFGISNCDLASANFSFSFLQPFSSSLQGLWFSTIRLHGNTLRANTINITSSQLNYMGIWNSQLQSVEPGAIIGNFSSAYIYLDNNNLTSFRSDVYLSVLQTMTNNTGGIYIYNNPIQYDCNLKWLIVDHPEWVSSYKVYGQIANGTFFHQLDAGVMANECGGSLSTTTAPSTALTTAASITSTLTLSSTTDVTTTVSPYACSSDYSPCNCTNYWEGFLYVSCVVNAQNDFVAIQKAFNQSTTFDHDYVHLLFNATNLAVPSNVLAGRRSRYFGFDCRYRTEVNASLVTIDSIAKDAFSSSANSTTAFLSVYNCDLTSVNFTFGFLQPFNSSLNGLSISNSQFAPAFPSMPHLPNLQSISIFQSSGLRQWYPACQTAGLQYLSLQYCKDFGDGTVGSILDSLAMSSCGDNNPSSAVSQLFLYGLSLTRVPPQMFSFPNLSYVILTQNPLKTLGVSSINITSSSLHGLYLDNAQLETVEPGAFVGNFSSTYIVLGSNNLTSFSSGAFLSVLQSMASGGGWIDVSNNPIQYNCNLTWLVVDHPEWLTSYKVYGQIANGTSFSQLDARAMASECGISTVN